MFEIRLNDYLILDTKGDPCYRTAFHFHTPAIEVFTYKKDIWVEWYREVGIRAPTTFIFHKSDYFWSFSIILLGFGISIAHQNGY